MPRFGRLQTLALGFGALGVFLLAYVAPSMESGDEKFLFEIRSASVTDPAGITFDPRTWTVAIALFFILTAIVAFVPRAERFTKACLGVSAALFVPLALVQGLALSEATSTNVVNLFVESIHLATPYALGAMCGLWCERSGVVNIGIEGMMLMSACTGFTMYAVMGDASGTGWLWIGILTAILTGGLLALLHAIVSVSFRTDQIISGVVINLLALGATSFIRSEVLVPRQLSSGETTSEISLWPLTEIPVIGEQVFRQKPIFWLTFVIVAITWAVIYRTPFGLRVRSVGENPHAAETLGINVIRIRYKAVIIGGLIAGLAGAWFSMGQKTGGFQDNMTSGAGFIALAALIFGRWRPWSAFAGAILFGFTKALGARFQLLKVEVGDFSIPSEFWQALPYVVTIIVVAGAVGRAIPPAADGQPYEPSR